MTGRLCILSCQNFYPEMAAAIAAEGWEEVTAVAFPARCGRPPMSWEELRPLAEGCDGAVVLGRACLHGLGEPPKGFPPVKLLPQGECFHQVAGPTLVAEAIGRGGYLITPAWLADWPGRLAELGFDERNAATLFGEFARELVLFDTGIDPQAPRRLRELAAVLGLPFSRIPLGLDYTRLLLNGLVQGWRLEQAQRAGKEAARRHAAELADHVSAMDLLARVARALQESETIDAIKETFQMLFAPRALHYLRVENGVPIPADPIPPELLEAMLGLTAPYAWSPSGEGFLLRIRRDDQVLGLVAVERLSFPQYRERYLNLALGLLGVFGLAIENARNRKRLVEAEKMASLGVMVAGVAHEINTPVGVGLTAASSLQQQSEQLAQRFAARSMTQSDLSGYLANAQSAAVLIRSHLERIGQLIDAFRQVAVDETALERRRFPLRRIIDEVVQSLGDRLSRGRIALEVDCDPALEIHSFPGDWATILLNLLTNSLKHGFRGRERGQIRIAVRLTESRLRVDYFDDGNGLTPEARARVFDPFFSTDLQHGMGLGMHLVYNLVTHRLRGGIVCDSRPGEGAHFHLEIPQ